MTAAQIVVIGAGIAGLAAAHRLAGAGQRVLLLEGSDRVGGKLRSESVAGVSVDVGAEAMLNRRPEGVELARLVGLGVVHPAVVKSHLWIGDTLRPLPRSLMGVPLDEAELIASRVLSERGLAQVSAERNLPPSVVDGDISVGDLVTARLGEEVVDRLVEPLLGGVYAGQAHRISARAAVPQLVAFATRGSILGQSALIPTTYDAPVFATVDGGMGRLPGAVADDLVRLGSQVRTGVMVRRIERSAGGFSIGYGPVPGEQTVTADRVVLAVPAPAASRLLGPLAADAAERLAAVELASVVVVTFAFRVGDLVGTAIPESGSGFLVPPSERRRIKAATFSFAKWEWVAEAGRGRGPEGEDLAFLRTSLGRAGDSTSLLASDSALVQRSLGDLRLATGLTADPVDTHVQRWGGGLPQYAVGHLDNVAAIRADVARTPGLAVCGATYDGVGIPAVIASGQRAADDVLHSL